MYTHLFWFECDTINNNVIRNNN